MATDFFQPIVFETYVDASVEKVFESLTTAEGWNSWFTSGTTMDLKNKTITFRWRDLGPEKVTDEASAKVVDYQKNSMFSFTWHEKMFPKPTRVIFDLKEKGRGTIVKLTDEGYPKTNEGEFMFMNCSAGWAEALTLMKVNLEANYRYKNW